MNKVRFFVSGIIIGIGVILPGVSGSVIAIMLGIYDKVIYLLNDNQKRIITKVVELLPVILGLFIGIMIFGNILLIFIEKYDIQVKYLFIGLILGGVPILKKEIDSKSNSGIKYKYTIITFIFSLILFLLPNLSSLENIENTESFFKMLAAGFLYIAGKIIPGISSSFFMMILGLYNYILNIMSNPFLLTTYEFVKLVPFFIGILLGFIILLKLINYLLSNYFSETYSIIIGFVLGSIIAIYPGFKLQGKYIFSVIIMVVSFCLTYKMSKKE